MAIDNVDKARPMREVESDLVDVVNDLVDTENAFNVIAPKTVLTPPTAQYNNALTIGNGAETTHYNTAVGYMAKAVGNANSTAYGENAECYNDYSVAIGSNSKTTASYQFSIGSNKAGHSFTRRLSFVSTPTEDDDAATKAYVDAHSGGTIEDGSVTTAKLADGAVTTAKVADKTVNEAKLTDALSVKLNERKGIEVVKWNYGTTIGGASSVTASITFNQTHDSVPCVLVTFKNTIYSNVFKWKLTECTTTSAQITFTNTLTVASPLYVDIIIIDRG